MWGPPGASTILYYVKTLVSKSGSFLSHVRPNVLQVVLLFLSEIIFPHSLCKTSLTVSLVVLTMSAILHSFNHLLNSAFLQSQFDREVYHFNFFLTWKNPFTTFQNFPLHIFLTKNLNIS